MASILARRRRRTKPAVGRVRIEDDARRGLHGQKPRAGRPKDCCSGPSRRRHCTVKDWLMTGHVSCPLSKRLRDLLDGQVPESEQSALGGHIERCATCQRTLAGLGGEMSIGPELARRLSRNGEPPDRELRQLLSDAKRPALAAAAGTSNDAVVLDFLQPSSDATHLGRLMHYEILEVVGQGGMGIVLK